MNKNKKHKGYALAIVIILTFVMTVIITATSILIMRYMMFAKKDLANFNNQNKITTTMTSQTSEVLKEVSLNA